jgi:hypothetical protein
MSSQYKKFVHTGRMRSISRTYIASNAAGDAVRSSKEGAAETVATRRRRTEVNRILLVLHLGVV